MDTHLKTAHQLLNEKSTVYDNQLTGFENMCKLYAISKDAIEIASKPDWYFPEKNELPKIGDRVYCVLKVGKSKGIAAMETDGFWYGETFTKHTNQIEAWTYLPAYRI